MAYAIASITPIELAGGKTLAKLKVTPDAATGSLALASYCKGQAIPLTYPSFQADLTANCYTGQAIQDGSTKTTINFKLWKAGGTAADTAYIAFEILVLLVDHTEALATL